MAQDSALQVDGSDNSFIFNKQVQLALQRSEELASEVTRPPAPCMRVADPKGLFDW